jgi:hypothetical protein
MESKNLFFDKKNQNLQNKKNAYFGVVVDNNDPNDSGMLYVRIPELDKNMDSKNLIKAYPLLSKVNNYTIPTIGEAVIIFLIDPDKPYTNRFWVGPIISQFQKMEQDPYQTALNLTDQPNNTPLKPISTIPTAKGLFPSKYERDVVYSLGRNNTDIKHEKNKITIRAGKHLTDKPTVRNEKNTALTQMYLSEDDKASYKLDYADYHLFLSYLSTQLTTQDLTESDYKNAIEKGYSFLKAEPTIELLKLVIKLLLEHTHPYNNIQTSNEVEDAKKLLNYDYDSIKSKYHKFN